MTRTSWSALGPADIAARRCTGRSPKLTSGRSPEPLRLPESPRYQRSALHGQGHTRAFRAGAGSRRPCLSRRDPCSNPVPSSGKSDELPPEQVRSRRISRVSAIGISRRLRGAPAFLHPWPERVRGSPRLRREKPVHSRRTALSVQRTAWPAAAAEPAAAGSARQRIRLDVGARLLGTASIREVSSGQPCGMVRLPALGNRAPGSRCAGRGNASSGCVGGG